MKGLTGVVLGSICAIVIACASAPKQSVAPAPVPSMMPRSPHDEIEALAHQIETQRVEIGLPQASPIPFTCAGPDCAAGAHAMAASATAPTLECKPTTETCTQTCTLADSICSNAKKICDIASQLDGDQWAATKCSDNTHTCDDANKRCCECAK
jgi:hypothetical protein